MNHDKDPGVSLYGVVANVLDYNTVLNEFEFWLRCYIPLIRLEKI